MADPSPGTDTRLDELAHFAYRVTGGRFGLARGWVDLDAVAIAFAVERVLVPFGASGW